MQFSLFTVMMLLVHIVIDSLGFSINRGSYFSAYVLLDLRKSDKMRGLLSILSPFRNEFDKFNNTVARLPQTMMARILLKIPFLA